MGADKLPTVQEFFPFWNKLSAEHRDDIITHSRKLSFEKGDMILPHKGECLGLVLLQRGKFRAYILSEGGREVTMYRLYDRDICLFAAASVLKNIQFDIYIEAEEKSTCLLIPIDLFSRLSVQSIEMSNYTNRLMASRFTEVMWTLEQILFKSMDSRLANALLQHSQDREDELLIVTHEMLARDVGTAREVVTRLLKYFSNEGIIEMTRGQIKIIDRARLDDISQI